MKKRIGIFLICIMMVTSLLVVFPIENVKAAIITFYPTDDTIIYKKAPNGPPQGEKISMAVSNAYGIGGDDIFENNSLIKFDLSSISYDRDINSASLKVYYYDMAGNNPTGRPLNLYRITSDWNEDTVTWNTQPSYAMLPTTYSIVPSPFNWMNWDVTSDVQGFLDGSFNNHGWKITDETYWGNASLPTTIFCTKEFGIYIPYLEINLNNPPNKPSRPAGPTTEWVGEHIEFSTNATDPDNNQIRYGWDWNGDDTIDEWSWLMTSGSTCYKKHTWYNTGTFNIKVIAKDSLGAVSNWSDVKTVNILVKNQPPTMPSDPYPADHSINVDINTYLSWTGGDPDVGDTVTYDVYFCSMPPFQKISSNISTTSFNPGTLFNGLTYIWRVVAWDKHGLSTDGPVWNFATINDNPPNKPSKPSGITSGKKGTAHSYTVSTTDPNYDNVYYWFDWGDGTNSDWDGPHKSGDNVTLAHSWIRQGTYPIKVKAKDIHGNESVWSDPLVISMPKTHIHNPIMELLLKMLERFPFFEKILNQLL